MTSTPRPSYTPAVVTLAACIAALAPAGALPPRVTPVNLPLTFERNTGHWPKQVEFVARSGQGALFVTKQGMVLALRAGGKSAALRLRLQGSNPGAVASGLDKQQGIVNYLTGNDPKQWRTRVPTYSRVKLAGVYPGIDLVAYGAGKGRALEYDFVVKPGADPRRIRMALSGARALRTVGGTVVASTQCGDVTLNRPYAYQTVGGVRKQVACSFALDRGSVAFEVARYDTSRPLVVDPTLVYSTFVGGTSGNTGTSCAVDASGAVTICGQTGDPYPLQGAFQGAYGGNTSDACVTKLNAGATALVYSTYLGGGGLDLAAAIVLDTTGAPTVVGTTASGNFPTTAGAYDTGFNGGLDAFVVRLAADGASLAFSTYLGGSETDSAYAVALDGSGAAYVAGTCDSPDFPTTPGAISEEFVGIGDCFVTKLQPNGAALAYSTLLGSNDYDCANDIAVNAAGEAYIVGMTSSVAFQTTSGAYDRTPNGSDDAFAAKLNATGTALIYSTLLGGSGSEEAYGVAIDAVGCAYITGGTISTDFPTTPGAAATSPTGFLDTFVTKLNATGSGLVYSTYLGGSVYQAGYSIAIAADGSAFICGETESDDFPGTGTGRPFAGGADAYVVMLSPAGAVIDCGTYLGGASTDFANCVVPIGGEVIVAGTVYSANFPTTPGVVQTAYGQLGDAFVARVALQSATSLVATGATGQVGEIVEFTATLTSGGSPVAGATVKFTTPDSVVTSRTTNASGVANLWYEIPIGAADTSIDIAFDATGSYQAAATTAPLTVTPVAKVVVPTITGKPGDAVTLYAYLWQGRTSVGITGQQLTYTIDGGAAVNFGALTAGAYGKATAAYTIPVGMAVGDHTITVDWAGTAGQPLRGGGYPAAQGVGKLTVTAASLRTYIWVHSHGATLNAATKLNCYLYEYRRNGDLIPLSGKPIAFTIAGSTVGTVNTAADGKASLPYTPTATGALAQGMSFAGDATYAATSNTGALTVTP